MTCKPVVIVLHGPAGVGKDSLIARLRERVPIHRATSTTTRPPRKGEVDGVDYFFVSEADFKQAIERGEFVEWANVYGDLKGVRASEITGPIQRCEDLIIRTDVQGARTWRSRLAGAIFIFLMAEDGEALRNRLISRGSESHKSLQRRLAELDVELRDMPNNDYVVYNHHGLLDDAVTQVIAIIEKERVNPARPTPGLRG